MDDDPPVKCAYCLNVLQTFETRIPFTATEDIVMVNCWLCKRMIYARKESRMIEEAKWKGAA